MKIFFYILLLTLIVSNAFSQIERVEKAYQYLKEEQPEKAKTEIEEAIKHTSTKEDPQTWYVRGFVYKAIFNKYDDENSMLASESRIEAIRSFEISMKLDTANEFYIENKANLDYLSTSYYNDAIKALNNDDPQSAKEFFDLYTSTIKAYVEPEEIEQKGVRFYLALATVYSSLYKNEPDSIKRNAFLRNALDNYDKVLQIDSNNISANYNMGIHYYNQAVDIIFAMGYATDLITVYEIQDECVILFKKALPYMLKAHKLEPENESTLIGLLGIYFSLNEKEKYQEIRKKLDNLDK